MMKLFYRRTLILLTLFGLFGAATLQANPYATHKHLARVSQGLVNLLAVEPSQWNSRVIQNLQNALYNPNEGTGLIIDFARIHVEEDDTQPVRRVRFNGFANDDDEESTPSEWTAACLEVEKALASMWKTLKLLLSYYEALEEDQKFADDIRASFGEAMNPQHRYYRFTYTHNVEMWQHRNDWHARGLEIPRRLIDSLREDLGRALIALHPLLQGELGVHLHVDVPDLNGTREIRFNETAMRSLANHFLGNIGIADTHFQIGPNIAIADILRNLREDLDALVPQAQAYTIDIDVEEVDDIDEEDEETENTEDQLTSSLESMNLSDDTTTSHGSFTDSPPRSNLTAFSDEEESEDKKKEEQDPMGQPTQYANMPANGYAYPPQQANNGYYMPPQQLHQQVQVQGFVYDPRTDRYYPQQQIQYVPAQQVAPGYEQYGYPLQPGQVPPMYQQPMNVNTNGGYYYQQQPVQQQQPVPTQEELDIRRLQQIWGDQQQPNVNTGALLLNIGAYGGCFG